jgi:hypothetical protein
VAFLFLAVEYAFTPGGGFALQVRAVMIRIGESTVPDTECRRHYIDEAFRAERRAARMAAVIRCEAISHQLGTTGCLGGGRPWLECANFELHDKFYPGLLSSYMSELNEDLSQK